MVDIGGACMAVCGIFLFQIFITQCIQQSTKSYASTLSAVALRHWCWAGCKRVCKKTLLGQVPSCKSRVSHTQVTSPLNLPLHHLWGNLSLRMFSGSLSA